MSGDVWYYALSDLFIKNGEKVVSDFSITQKRYSRNLNTDSKGLISKAENRVNLIEKGSVFLNACPFEGLLDENAKTIGYNSVIKIGGGN